MHKSIDTVTQPVGKVLVNYRVSPVIRDALRRNAKRTGRTMNVTVELALELFKPLQEDLKAVKEAYDK